MGNDEKAIRTLIADWLSATAADDLPPVLKLMDENVVFLQPGRPPIRGRDAYEAAARAGVGKIRVDGKSDVQEVQIMGDWAYCWNHLTVTITPLNGDPPMRHTGNVLSILRKKTDGSWVLFRDANLLTPEFPS
jgi:uncharacterized protein (TIGR02246 family)